MRARAIALGCVVGAIVAVLLGVVVARDGVEALYHSDAPLFRRVAADPFGTGDTFEGVVGPGTAYRYGRILYPLAAWTIAGGRPGAVTWTLLVVHVLAVAAMFALACDLCRARGVSPERGLWIVLAPSLLLVLPIAVSEPFVTALILLTYRLALAGRERAAAAAGAAVVLAREAAVVALVPLAWRALRERRYGRAATWAAAVVPWLGWSAWVRARVGEWPFLDGAIARREALAAPFAGPIRAIRDGVAQPGWLAAALAAAGATIVLAAWAARRARWFPVSGGALALALVFVVFGRWVWRFPGDALRVMLPAQALAILALVARGRSPDEAGEPLHGGVGE